MGSAAYSLYHDKPRTLDEAEARARQRFLMHQAGGIMTANHNMAYVEISRVRSRGIQAWRMGKEGGQDGWRRVCMVGNSRAERAD